MARNHEKGRSMLHQWARLKSGFDNDNNKKRPGNTKMCDNVNDAEKWRRDVMKEISKYTSEISNPDLADNMTRVRELNDQINKLLRVKFYWEKPIIELGGVDYIRASNSRNRGRKQIYFGVAKQLPEAQKNDSNNEIQYKPKVSLKTLNQRLTNDYYGIGHENQTMLSEEAAIEKQIGNEDEAIEILNKTILDFPNYVQSYFNLGKIYQDLNQNKIAIKNFEKAKSLKNDFFQADISIAKIHLL